MKDAPRRDGGAARAPRNAPLRTPVHPLEHARVAPNARADQGSSRFFEALRASGQGASAWESGDRRTRAGSSQPALSGSSRHDRDLNAPPLRSPKTPHAPSISMVGGVIGPRGRGLFSAKLAKRGQARARSVQALRSAEPTHSPGGGARLPDRSAARGDVGGGVPQPTGSSTAGRPTQDPWKRSRHGRRRAHGQAHGHTAGARRNGTYIPRTSVRTTIPPSGTMPLNAWDAANYAGFTNAAWLCQRGSRLCRGVAHVQGATRAERKTRHRSRPRGNQQRRTRASRQRPWRSTRVDSSLRQDVGGALGVEGHGAAGRRAAPHRGRHRPETRPPGAAPRDRPGGRGSRTRSGPRLPQDVGQAVRSATDLYRLDLAGRRAAPAASGSRSPDRSQ